MNQIKNKAQDILVNTGCGTRHIARNFIRAGENNNRVSTFKYFLCFLFLKYHLWNVHVFGIFSWTVVFRFKPTNKKFDFIELTSFKSFDIKVPCFYFGSMPLFAHKPFLQSAGKPLNAHYCIWARSHHGLHYNCAYIQRWSDSVFLVSDPILFLKNDIRNRSESCFGWNHTIHIRKLSESVSWSTTYFFVFCLFCLMRQNKFWSYFSGITSGVILPSTEHDWLK